MQCSSEGRVAVENIPAIERFIFLQELSQAIDSSSISEQHMGLVLVDLSNLARVNHRHGYHWGDRLLIVAYEQLLQ